MSKRKISIAILIVIGLADIFFTYQLKNISYNYDITTFYPKGDANTQFFKEHVQRFESENDFLLMGLQNRKGIFQKDFLVRVDSLAREINALPLVTKVIAPTNVKEYQRVVFSSKPTQFPYLHFKDPTRYEADSLKIYQAPHLVDFLFSENAQSVLIYVQTKDFLGEADCRKFTDQINTILNTYTFDQIHLGGKCHSQTNFIDLIQSESKIFTTANVLFLILCLLITYRTFWGVWIPMLVVGLAVVWTIAIMILMGKEIDFVANLLPTIILIIGISDSIHLLTHYLSKIRQGVSKMEALTTSVKEVGIATLMTTCTTALGFLTLTTSSFSSIVDMGIYATVGLLLAFCFTYLVIPSVLVLHPPLVPRAEDSKSFWDDKLKHSYKWVIKNQNTILWSSGLVLLLGIIGSSQIKLNTYILQDLRKDHPMWQDFNFFGNEFGGARPFEMAVTVQDSQTVFSPSILMEIHSIDSFLIHQYGVKNLVSPAVLIQHAHLIYRRQKKGAYRLPESASIIATLERNLFKNESQFEIDRFVTQNRQQSRITGRIPDWGSYLVDKKNDTLQQFIQQNFPNSPVQYRLTGSPQLVDINSAFLAQDVLKGLFIAVVVIGLLFAYILRSYKMIALALIPNLLPLLFIGGFMGFFGIDLKYSTSIIFIIAFGIAVDDSIHFLSRFWREVKHKSVEEAVYHTYMTTGKAIVLTSFVLVGGFLIICVSDFLATVYIGLLIALTLLVALVADLTLLPVLLLKFYQKPNNEE